MTPLRRANNFLSEFFSGIKNDPYLILNTIFAGVILLIFFYSVIFSPDKNNYPVICIREKITGLPCFSCGLTHSFSLIVRGKIEEAHKWNIYGMRVFLFFASQLFMRIIFSVIYQRNKNNRKWLIWYDITGSVLMFAIAFYPFFRQFVSELFC